MTNIFIANLDFGITSEDLRATFSQFGEVSYAHVVYDNKTKKSKGYGYVEMEDLSLANAAISALNGMEVNGRVLDVKLATPKEKRPQNINKPKESFKSKPSRPERSDRPSKPRKEVKEVKTSERRVMRPRRKRKED
ncbi:RNA recognition motif domain-containing protein [Brumimicrobium aurantiacum]|uniref:RNA-binding protein n=1 Tax=Brumimicrobium aurantiacum TaxID=1737063 RepID=A0A3E1F077_9FLAO|nr:RNA-binding protein [Brumimicrobium aurantiacum]RFC55107.1 RNA-binding protein [Brumimicrobium aurantiacum]